MANRGAGKVEVVTDFLLGSKITVDGDCSHEIRRHLLLGRRAMTNLDSVLKSRHYSADKGPYGQGYGLPSGRVQLWESDCKEAWVPKNWCLLTVVLEKTPESPLDSKEIKPVSLKGDQPWIFTGRTEAKAEASVFWSFDANRWLTGRVPDAGKDWGQKGKRASEDEMARWHHWLQWTWTWANSGRWRRTGRPGMLQGMGSQRVRHDWATERQHHHTVFQWRMYDGKRLLTLQLLTT